MAVRFGKDYTITVVVHCCALSLNFFFFFFFQDIGRQLLCYQDALEIVKEISFKVFSQNLFNRMINKYVTGGLLQSQVTFILVQQSKFHSVLHTKTKNNTHNNKNSLTTVGCCQTILQNNVV